MAKIMDMSKGEFLHLGLGATTVPLPKFTGEMDWYQQYGTDHAMDGFEGRLVSMHTFTESWDVWEMHPNGSELVICTAGSVTLTQEDQEGNTETATISAGQAMINEPGVWHTADVPDGVDSTTMLFITAGVGTENRPR